MKIVGGFLIGYLNGCLTSTMSKLDLENFICCFHYANIFELSGFDYSKTRKSIGINPNPERRANNPT